MLSVLDGVYFSCEEEDRTWDVPQYLGSGTVEGMAAAADLRHYHLRFGAPGHRAATSDILRNHPWRQQQHGRPSSLPPFPHALTRVNSRTRNATLSRLSPATPSLMPHFPSLPTLRHLFPPQPAHSNPSTPPPAPPYALPLPRAVASTLCSPPPPALPPLPPTLFARSLLLMAASSPTTYTRGEASGCARARSACSAASGVAGAASRRPSSSSPSSTTTSSGNSSRGWGRRD